jgi:Trp operon repressor
MEADVTDPHDALLADMLKRDLRDTIKRASQLINQILEALPAALDNPDKEIAEKLGLNYAHQIAVREKAELALMGLRKTKEPNTGEG